MSKPNTAETVMLRSDLTQASYRANNDFFLALKFLDKCKINPLNEILDDLEALKEAVYARTNNYYDKFDSIIIKLAKVKKELK